MQKCLKSKPQKDQKDDVNFTLEVSIKISKEEHEALRIICFRDRITPPKIVKRLLQKAIRNDIRKCLDADIRRWLKR